MVSKLIKSIASIKQVKNSEDPAPIQPKEDSAAEKAIPPVTPVEDSDQNEEAKPKHKLSETVRRLIESKENMGAMENQMPVVIFEVLAETACR